MLFRPKSCRVVLWCSQLCLAWVMMHDVVWMQERFQTGSKERSEYFHLFATKHISFFPTSETRQCGPSRLPWLGLCFLACSVCRVKRWVTKTNMRNHLQAQATLESNHCIACAKSEGTTCYYSPGGRNEYERTGVCERIACSIPRLPCKKSSNSAINWIPLAWNKRVIG